MIALIQCKIIVMWSDELMIKRSTAKRERDNPLIVMAIKFQTRGKRRRAFVG
ncbi:hypothetical protein CSSP291_16215 [Cronobacter sakazakii SP291]|uniref:Uncharacterized protein n=1 Tax=Cronobacter sakazakii (strain ATCC BAA-894) TaxID=290339 RepID=A7MIU1_CROS8|nr:hypothetical protein ESA_03494 [Cronobacter sakazakii ATCC BAA-894]AGE87812.1 hypothetical protein CSSP291_16215 [Cronobacter sakazakii SP291]EGL73575.1 hypothetical protein CSE899_05137 [Cronobacter sakazakii E899]